MEINREEFLNKLTGGLAVTCVACMAAACSSESPEPSSSPSGSNPTGNTASLTVDLATEIRNINEFVAKNNIIVIRTSAGNALTSFLAVSSVCPHAGSRVEYNNSTSSFFCAAHGSTFNATGAFVQGPPGTTGLKKLTIQITGSTLTVKS
jgi:cytochrome b6-f complex iron-sulfur subunit